MNPQEFLANLNAKTGKRIFRCPMHFYNAIRKHFAPDWQWPLPEAREDWKKAEQYGLDYAKQKEVMGEE